MKILERRKTQNAPGMLNQQNKSAQQLYREQKYPHSKYTLQERHQNLQMESEDLPDEKPS